MRHKGRWVAGLMMAAGLLWSADLHAQAVITNGTITLGVNAAGHLNLSGPGSTNPATGHPYGLSRGPFEYTSPGCLCEGWGAGIVGGTHDDLAIGYDMAIGGTSALTNGGATASAPAFASTASTATSSVDIMSGMTPIMRITHAYSPSASPDLYRVDVTLENLTGAVLGMGSEGIRYRRLMDWDIQPTEFSEFVTIQGNSATALLGTSTDGFNSPLPAGLGGTRPSICGAPVDTDFTDIGPCDHGALFDFAFPELAAGASRTFTTFYGGAATQALALAALGTVGAEVYSFGQCNPAADARCSPATGTPSTAIFAFAGVGGTPVPPPTVVPEPTALILLGTGLLGVAAVATRRRREDEIDAE